MKRLLVLGVLTLAACSTPKTVLQDKDTGQVVVCGGGTAAGVIGGAAGMYLQRKADDSCIEEAKAKGLTIISQEEQPPIDATAKPKSAQH